MAFVEIKIKSYWWSAAPILDTIKWNVFDIILPRSEGGFLVMNRDLGRFRTSQRPHKSNKKMSQAGFKHAYTSKGNKFRIYYKVPRFDMDLRAKFHDQMSAVQKEEKKTTSGRF
jgi:hypothetical protein